MVILMMVLKKSERTKKTMLQYKSHLKAIWKCSQGKMHASKGSKVLLLISLDKEGLEGHPWEAQWRRQLLLGCVQKRSIRWGWGSSVQQCWRLASHKMVRYWCGCEGLTVTRGITMEMRAWNGNKRVGLNKSLEWGWTLGSWRRI